MKIDKTTTETPDKEPQEAWIIEATALFYEYREDARRCRDTIELAYMFTGMTHSLYVLLDKFDALPDLRVQKAKPEHPIGGQLL